MVQVAANSPGAQRILVEFDVEAVGDGEPVGQVVVVGFCGQGLDRLGQQPMVAVGSFGGPVDYAFFGSSASRWIIRSMAVTGAEVFMGQSRQEKS